MASILEIKSLDNDTLRIIFNIVANSSPNEFKEKEEK